MSKSASQQPNAPNASSFGTSPIPNQGNVGGAPDSIGTQQGQGSNGFSWANNPVLAGYASTATPDTASILDQRAQAAQASGNPGQWLNGVQATYGPQASTAASQLPPGTSMSNGVPTAPSPSLQTPATQTATQSNGAPMNPVNATQAPVTNFTPAGLPSGGSDVASMMQQASDAAYKNATGYLDPQFANAQQALQSQLVNQGIPQNSEAWNKAMDDFNRQKTFAYSQAQSGAYGQGLTAQNQVAQQLLAQLGLNTQQNVANIGANASMFNSQNATNLGFGQLGEQTQQDLFNNSMGTRQQDINELLLQQQNPLNMATALTNGTGAQQPNFSQTPSSNVDPTNIAQIISQALGQQNNVYNTQTGAANSANSGMASILAALLSDRRVKTNIKQIGMHECGVPLYSYNYATGEPGFGVLADELEKVMPDAVWKDANGLQMVNYGAISRKQ